MEVKEYIQHQFAIMRRLSDAVTIDITDEQFNWMPTGTANPIRAIFLHVVAAEDSFVQRFFQAKPTVWQVEKWSERIGVAVAPGRGQGWEEARSQNLAIATVRSYQQAVRAATDAYLAGVSPAELDRQINFAGGDRSLGEMLSTLTAHTMHHIGEIAALKGLQGAKGLPF